MSISKCVQESEQNRILSSLSEFFTYIIIKSHNGLITVESEKWMGSTLRFFVGREAVVWKKQADEKIQNGNETLTASTARPNPSCKKVATGLFRNRSTCGKSPGK